VSDFVRYRIAWRPMLAPPLEILTRSRCLNRWFQLNPVRSTTVDNSANPVDPGT
jgi:hypothetical protein